MTMEELKELYINKNPNADNEAKIWSKEVFGTNVNGDSFWSIGIEFVCELIQLLGYTKNYEKISLSELELFLDDDKKIIHLLNQVNHNYFEKLRIYLTLNEPVKNALYEFIKGKFRHYSEWQQLLKKQEINVEEEIQDKQYLGLKRDIFILEEGHYTAEYLLFHNMKVRKIDIYCSLDDGMELLDKVNQVYVDENFKKMCADLMVGDEELMYDWGLSGDFDDGIVTSERVMKSLKDVVFIDVLKEYMKINFQLIETGHLLGGHDPILYLYPDSDYKFVGLE